MTPSAARRLQRERFDQAVKQHADFSRRQWPIVAISMARGPRVFFAHRGERARSSRAEAHGTCSRASLMWTSIDRAVPAQLSERAATGARADCWVYSWAVGTEVFASWLGCCAWKVLAKSNLVK